MFFEVAPAPEAPHPDDIGMYRKARHGLDSPYHIIETSHLPATDEYDEEWEYDLTHPASCSDDAACEFEDFEDYESEPGRRFVSYRSFQHGAPSYEWDGEYVDHGPVPRA